VNVLKEEERAVDVEVCCVGFTVMLTELARQMSVRSMKAQKSPTLDGVGSSTTATSLRRLPHSSIQSSLRS